MEGADLVQPGAGQEAGRLPVIRGFPRQGVRAGWGGEAHEVRGPQGADEVHGGEEPEPGVDGVLQGLFLQGPLLPGFFVPAGPGHAGEVMDGVGPVKGRVPGPYVDGIAPGEEGAFGHHGDQEVLEEEKGSAAEPDGGGGEELLDVPCPQVPGLLLQGKEGLVRHGEGSLLPRCALPVQVVPQGGAGIRELP